MPQVLEDDSPSTLDVENIKFVNVRQVGEYTTQILAEAEHINQLTSSSAYGHLEITTHFYMYTLGYTFHLQGFMKEVFRYYQLGPSQLYPNKWIIFFAFDKFLRLVIIEPIISVFRTCYHLVASTNGDNDIYWFFNFTNRPIRAMKGTLQGKPAYVKK